MHIRPALALLVAAGLTLAAFLTACQRKDEAPQGASSVAAHAVTRPVLKAGLWEKRWSLPGLDAVQRARFCVDAASQEKAALWTGEDPSAGCDQPTIAHAADGSWTFSLTCDHGSGGKVTTKGAAAGDFDRRYQSKAQVSTTGAALAQMNRSDTVTAEFVWMGACPPEMKPGQFDGPAQGDPGRALSGR